MSPLTEQIRLRILGSPNYTFFPYNKVTPVYSRDNLTDILGTPVKTCLKVTRTPANFGSRNYFKSDLLRLRHITNKPRDECNEPSLHCVAESRNTWNESWSDEFIQRITEEAIVAQCCRVTE